MSQKKENKNSIEATYKIKEGKSISLFNPKELNITDNDYSIDGEIVSENKKYSRRLKAIPVENGEYYPSESGYLNIKINFSRHLKSLNYSLKIVKI